MIALFINPRSGANRRDPTLRERLAETLGGSGILFAPPSLEALAQEAQQLAQAPPDIVAVHGGDGTLQTVVTALARAFGERPLPPVAALGGGTMNVVRSSLDFTRPAQDFLRDLRKGAAPRYITRRCMRLGDRYGFVFGNGLAPQFLEAYYEGGRSGHARAAWLVARTAASAIVGGPLVHRVFRRFRGRVSFDDRVLERTDFTAVTVSTVREIGFGMKLHHRADEDPSRLCAVALYGDVFSILGDLPAVRRGEGVPGAHAETTLARRVVITPDEPEMAYTLDGDLYHSQGPLSIELGPEIRFIDPR